MVKNRMHPTKAGKSTRMSYSTRKEILDMPNFIEIQKKSYEWFITDGLKEAFADISPIEDYNGNLSLEFLDFRLCTNREDIKYDIEECKERDATYAAPLRAKVRLRNKEQDGQLLEYEIFMGDLPIMTDTGTFVINGAERVIVSQLVRSPGIYFDITRDKTGKKLYSSQVIPNRGAWLEYETDSNDIFYVRVDRTRKVPVSVLIRAMGIGPDHYEDGSPRENGSDEDILELFGDDPLLLKSMEKESTLRKESEKEKPLSRATGLLSLYEKIRPGEPASVESAESLIMGMFFDPRRYDLAKTGRYKYNKKLNFRYRLKGQKLAETVGFTDPKTGEIVTFEAGETLTEEQALQLQNAGVKSVMIATEERNVKVLSNLMVDVGFYVDFDCRELGIHEAVYYPVLMELLAKGLSEDELKDEMRRSAHDLVPKHITKEDIFASINYLLHLQYGVGNKDDIDHLGNRRIRAVGELLQNQYRIGLSRMERVVRERMTTQNISEVTPQSLINIKPVTAAVKEFFGSSQLSQFMDQNNPLGELTHKRRLSALGPGGLSRDRAGFEVRDVHYTHYGRMCPIETPEGPNIGLINSLACYARLNEYGFIEAPYRRVDKSDPKNPVVTDEVVYLTADEEDNYIVAQANEPLDAEGHFINDNVSGRFREATSQFRKATIDFMDVSPKMVFSVATSMIPFLENDDANRALMGSNMQRQAVPLMITEEPVVGTGMEAKAAVDSGVCVVAKRAGTVLYANSTDITLRYDDDGTTEKYKLIKFARSNQSNCYNQKPIVSKGDHVEAGEVIADGASTCGGEIALGKNPLIGFMTWEGYNYEDAVLLSERLVKDDVYTSIHIEEYEAEARDTKLGPEEITRDVPGVGDEALKDLDERGIIRVGAEVRAGDILVGKVTPKGETELTAEERLLRAIFGEKAREVRDTSLKVPHGEYGIIVDAKVFTRENGDEMAPGVRETVRIYIAQKRKISVGDKMAGRHGNKGVVSRILPVEDMPFLPNGRPLDIVLNPLGVPSRMNIGQVLEIHLSLAAKALGFNISTPVFDGADEEDIMDALDMANDYVNTEWDEFKAKYEDSVDPEIMEYLGSHLDHRKEWKGVPISRDGKVRLRDGRTGEYFDSPVTIGHMHYLKLHHLVDDKIHARSTGPYSLVTQQPLGGKAQFGGQRFGEMEVWALEAYGAAYTLQEILTVKSDDVVGRVKTYEAIVKGRNIPEPGIPESFKVLLKEMQSLALDVRVLDEDDNEIELKESIDYGETSFSAILNEKGYHDRDREDREKESLVKKGGYTEQKVEDGRVIEDEIDDVGQTSTDLYEDNADDGDSYDAVEDSSYEAEEDSYTDSSYSQDTSYGSTDAYDADDSYADDSYGDGDDAYDDYGDGAYDSYGSYDDYGDGNHEE